MWIFGNYSGIFLDERPFQVKRTVKKIQNKSHLKVVSGKMKEVAVKGVEIPEPGHKNIMKNAQLTIEAAYADLNNGYKKVG